MIKYYSINVFKSRLDNYSLFVAIDHNKVLEDDEESIIEHLIEINTLEAKEASYVQAIEEIDYDTYKLFN